MGNSKHQIFIGTSGWNYKHWKGTYYPEDLKTADQFSYYRNSFNTVELNSSFYHLPKKETFAKWEETVPDDFLFSVKASRYITHMKKLKDAGESVGYFLENASALKMKLGPVLFQLPPFLKKDVVKLDQFLKILPRAHRYVFEFRNDTWYDSEIYELLQMHNAAFCIYELDGHITPFQITADFIYVRLHGPGQKYQGSYSDEQLQEWANLCQTWLKDKDVFIYFDNDQEGFAAFNAIKLNQLVAEAGI